MQSFLWLLAFTVTPAVISWSYHGHILTLKPLQTGLNLDVLMSCYGHISKQWAHGALSQVWKKLVDLQNLFYQLPIEDVWTLSEGRWGESMVPQLSAGAGDEEELVSAEKAASSRGKLLLRGSTHLQWTTSCTRFAMNHPLAHLLQCNDHEPPSALQCNVHVLQEHSLFNIALHWQCNAVHLHHPPSHCCVVLHQHLDVKPVAVRDQSNKAVHSKRRF